jgi:hypothetical protein
MFDAPRFAPKACGERFTREDCCGVKVRHPGRFDCTGAVAPPAPRFGWKPGSERFALPDCDGVKVRHPGRLDSTGARDAGWFGFIARSGVPVDARLDGRANEPALRLMPAFGREAGVKKRWEFGGTPRNADGFAARPDGLKLSRDGVTGILPLIMLACRKAAALILSCCRGTAARPNSLPGMDDMPPRTRLFRKASLMFENERAPRRPSGANPS